MDEQVATGPMAGRAQPSREQVREMPRLTVLDHPLGNNLVTILRNIEVPSAEFERAIHELTRRLLWEATMFEPLTPTSIRSFSDADVEGSQLSRKMAALVILRAGLSMVPPLRSLIPDTPIYQVGVKRDEQSLEPRLYYSNIPAGFSDVEHLFLLDPMLATGGSAVLSLKLIRAVYQGDVSFLGLIGAPIGVATLLQADHNVHIYLAALDERLNDRGYIIPGLGDAGDRLFGTN